MEIIESQGLNISDRADDILIRFLEKARVEGMSPNEVNGFGRFLVYLCKECTYPDATGELPKIGEPIQKKLSWGGVFYNEDNEIRYNKIFEKMLTDTKNGMSENIVDFIDTIAHEMTHWAQQETLNRYKNLPDDERKEIDDDMYKVLADFEYNKTIDKHDALQFFKSIRPYLNYDERKEIRSNINDIVFAQYYTQADEKQARDSALIFTERLIKHVQTNPNASEPLKDWAVKQLEKVASLRKEEEKKYSDNLEFNRMIDKEFDITNAQILNISKKLEKKGIKDFVQSRLVYLMIKNKSLEEKLNLLQDGLNLKNLGIIGATLRALATEKGNVKDKESFEKSIVDALTKSDVNLNYLTFTDTKLLLSDESVKKIMLKDCLEDGTFTVNKMYFYKDRIRFTKDEILDVFSKYKGDVVGGEHTLLLDATSFETKMELLNSKEAKINRDLCYYVASHIMRDKQYAENKEQIDNKIRELKLDYILERQEDKQSNK